MGLRNFMTDPIVLVRKGGERVEVMSSFQKGKVFIDSDKLGIDDGDLLERKLPSGQVETYLINHAHFNTGRGGIPSFWELDVSKTTSIPKPSGAPQIHFHGDHGRVNIGSIDQSINASGSIGDLFSQLRQVAETRIEDEGTRQRLTELINRMEAEKGKPSFVDRYKDFIANAANHVTAFAPLLPALTQLLQ